jgi:hypothetical protein
LKVLLKGTDVLGNGERDEIKSTIISAFGISEFHYWITEKFTGM